ncbi:MAG: NAD(P)/FAD-dependent oxidoreductase [Chloroflexi bacterium]|nr:NAD(P)/FAD-dependent oxidoreductase [Chloroflexota bacterium]
MRRYAGSVRDESRLAESSAVVVGSGPNGLAAAIELARHGARVTVLEAEDTIGGGCRSAELTLPGSVHDVCSAIHPLAAASPFFARLPLADHGVQWIHPTAPLAHPLDDGTAVLVHRSIERTAVALGADAGAWSRTIGRVARDLPKLRSVVTGPALAFPRHPVALARFGLMSLWPARLFARRAFRTDRARAAFAGLAAHSFLSLDAPLSTTFALMLGGTAHAVGWPMPRGGSQRVVDALAAILRAHGGEIVTGRRVGSMADLPRADATLFDVTPRQLERIAGDRFPEGYRRALRRYRYGPGVFKVDYALDGPVPWRAPDCGLAGTVHVGGTLDEIADSEGEVARGGHPERPFALVAQQSLFDPSRAPAGKHTLWAYCHVPNGSTVDMTARIEAQIERFAPGFRDRIIARHVMDTRWVEAHNETYVGGDISAGSHGGLQLFARPVLSIDPYATPDRSIYLCSAATPPGGGVHGMCGYHAARSAMRRAWKGG